MTRTIAIEAILLAAWLGAAVLVAAAVAPAAFRVLPTRTLAGAVVGEVLPVIFFAGLLIAAIALGLEAVSGARWSRLTVLVPYIALMLGCIVAQFIIGPKIEAVRSGITGALDALDPSDPRRVQFGRLHAFSVLWMGVAMIGAVSALVRILHDNKN